jgi:hypothetical protein
LVLKRHPNDPHFSCSRVTPSVFYGQSYKSGKVGRLLRDVSDWLN